MMLSGVNDDPVSSPSPVAYPVVSNSPSYMALLKSIGTTLGKLYDATWGLLWVVLFFFIFVCTQLTYGCP